MASRNCKKGNKDTVRGTSKKSKDGLQTQPIFNSIEEKNHILDQLKEMFQEVVDIEVINSVAENCNYNRQASVEALMMISNDADISSASHLEARNIYVPELPLHRLKPPRASLSREIHVPELPIKHPPRALGARNKLIVAEYQNKIKKKKNSPFSGFSSNSPTRISEKNEMPTSGQGAIKVAYRCPNNFEGSDSDADVVIEEEKEYDMATGNSFTLSDTPCSTIPQFLTPMISLQHRSQNKSNLKMKKQQSVAAVCGLQTVSQSSSVSSAFTNKVSPNSMTSTHTMNSKITISASGEIQKHILQGTRLMILMRGVPGSGKSSLAKNIIQQTLGKNIDCSKYIFSTDDFFVSLGLFIPNMLPEAHTWNKKRVWEMEPYALLAVQHGYILKLLEPSTPWRYQASKLVKKNIHGVQFQQIHNMLTRFEKDLTGTKLISMLKLHYSSNNKPPQPAASKPTMNPKRKNVQCAVSNAADSFTKKNTRRRKKPSKQVLSHSENLQETFDTQFDDARKMNDLTLFSTENCLEENKKLDPCIANKLIISDEEWKYESDSDEASENANKPEEKLNVTEQCWEYILVSEDSKWIYQRDHSETLENNTEELLIDLTHEIENDIDLSGVSQVFDVKLSDETLFPSVAVSEDLLGKHASKLTESAKSDFNITNIAVDKRSPINVDFSLEELNQWLYEMDPCLDPTRELHITEPMHQSQQKSTFYSKIDNIENRDISSKHSSVTEDLVHIPSMIMSADIRYPKSSMEETDCKAENVIEVAMVNNENSNEGNNLELSTINNEQKILESRVIHDEYKIGLQSNSTILAMTSETLVDIENNKSDPIYVESVLTQNKSFLIPDNAVIPSVQQYEPQIFNDEPSNSELIRVKELDDRLNTDINFVFALEKDNLEKLKDSKKQSDNSSILTESNVCRLLQKHKMSEPVGQSSDCLLEEGTNKNNFLSASCVDSYDMMEKEKVVNECVLQMSPKMVPLHDQIPWVLTANENQNANDEWEQNLEEVENSLRKSCMPLPARDQRSPRKNLKPLRQTMEKRTFVQEQEIQIWDTVAEPLVTWETKNEPENSIMNVTKQSDDPQPQRSVFSSLIDGNKFLSYSTPDYSFVHQQKQISESSNEIILQSKVDKSTITQCQYFSLSMQLSKTIGIPEVKENVKIMTAYNKPINDSKDDLKEIFEKCCFNLNWTIDLLLESKLENFDHGTCVQSQNKVSQNIQKEEIKANLEEMYISPKDEMDETAKKVWQEEVKKYLEDSVVMSEESYPEHTLLIKKSRYGNIMDTNQDTKGQFDINPSAIVTDQEAAGSSILEREVKAGDDDESESTISSSSEEEEMLSVSLDSGFINQLHEKFGNPFPYYEGKD
ncbi:hypothetical protein C0J52_23935 [Blattella germanica]|nr:hypothetical protein C0J52_23935 [Blattella germanica]